jgi:hypothetical protein
MGFWNKFSKSSDPLLKLMFERYNLSLLSIPRENASVGDLYMQDGNQNLSTPGNIKNFLTGEFQIPSISTGEIMADVTGTTSRDASGKAGMNFLEGFLNALGPAGIGITVRGSYERRSQNKIIFTFQNPTRDYVDVFELGKSLINYRIMKENALYAKDRRFYIITAVARSSSIGIISEHNSKQTVDVDTGIMNLAKVSGGISIENSGAGQITFKGQKNLAFGVELYELKWLEDGDEARFQMGSIEKPVVARGEVGGIKKITREQFYDKIKPIELLDPDEDVILIA